MKDSGKTKAQLNAELETLRRRVAELESAEAEHRQTLEALRASESFYQSLVEIVPQSLCRKDLAGRFTFGNQHFCDSVNRPLADIIGKTDSDIHPPDLVEKDRQDDRWVIETGQILEVVEERRLLGGETGYVHVVKSPIREADGKITGVQIIFRDITEQRQAEAALRRQNEYLAALQETTLDLISRLDLGNLLENIVKRAGQLMGTSAGYLDLVEPGTDQLKPKVGLGALTESLAFEVVRGEGVAGTVWQTGQPLVIDDYDAWPGRIADYSRNTIRAIVGVPLLAGSRVLGVLGLAYEAGTQRVFGSEAIELLIQFARLAAIAIENARLVEALRRQTVELEARNEDLNAFAHTVAHDLLNPVGLVLGFAETMVQDDAAMPDDQRQQSLQAIARNARKIGRIIDDLLLLAGVREQTAEASTLEMAGIVTESVNRLADMIESAQAEIVLPDMSAWPAAVGYGPWVEEVWVNYLSNAIAYGGRPPRVDLGVEAQPDGMLRFWVRDNGNGLTPEDQARLFTPFTRLDQVRAKGHGLGLSIVRRIVEKLGGQVGVESRAGAGSRFYFTLPGDHSQAHPVNQVSSASRADPR